MSVKKIIILFLFSCCFVTHADDELVQIKKIMPGKVKAKKKYKVLCFSKPFGFPHSSIKPAKKMFQVMADKDVT